MMITNIIGEIFILIVFVIVALNNDLDNLIYVIALALFISFVMSNLALYLIIKKRDSKRNEDSEFEQSNEDYSNDSFNK